MAGQEEFSYTAIIMGTPFWNEGKWPERLKSIAGLN